MKKLLSVVLTLSMILALTVAFASFSFADTPEGTAIRTVDDFLAMEKDGTYYLENDIDFENVTYNGRIYQNDFRGTLDGNGHSLLNIKIETDADAGVFGERFGGTLKNITFGSETAPAKVTSTGGGKAVAVVAITCSEDSTFENVTVWADLFCDKDSKVGAFAGWIASGKTLNFTDCTVNGNVTGGPAAGYVVTNRSDAVNLNFTNCVNNANVSTGDAAGRPTAGFFTIHWAGTTENVFNIAVKNCVNNGTISAYKDGNGGTAAGFICPDREMRVNCTIENSINNGIIDGGKGSAGGLFSVRVDSNSAGHPITLTVKNSVNTGAVSAADWRAGGIVGIFGMNSASKLTLDHCYNTGSVTNNGGGGNACGIVGELSQMGCDADATRIITNCYNIGTLTTNTSEICRVGGGDQAAQTVSNCFYTVEGARAIEGGCTTNNVTFVADAAALLAALQACEPENAAVTFVADSENINGGYPVLSWQITEEPEDTTPDPEPDPEPEKTPAFSAGTIEKTDDGKYTIASDGFSAFISTRRNATNAAHNDIRVILATDIEGLDAYMGLNLTLTFKKDSAVVKTATWDVVKDLKFYASASAAGNTYTAADGCALFGIVITGVPNADWDEVTATVTDNTGKGVGEGSANADGLVVPAPVDIKGELGSLVIEDHHASLDKWPSLVFSIDNTTLWQTLRGDKANYPDDDHWSNPAYKWVLTVNGEEIVPEKFSIYDGDAWGYFRAAIAPKDALDYVDNTATLDITLNIYDNTTGYLVYFADLDPLTYDRPVIPVHDPIHIDSVEGVEAHLWGTPFETPGGLGGKAALIYRVTGIFETINGYISDEVAYAKVTLNGTVYTIKNYENGGDIFRFDVQSEGAVIYSGLTYKVKVEFFNVNDQLLYYSNEYTCVSTMTSSNAPTRTPMNVTLPGGLNKLTVDTTKLSTENINHWGDGPVANLFDGKTGVGGSDGSKIGGGKGAGDPTVYFSLTEAATISYFTFTTGGDTGTYTGRNPYGFTLYGKVGSEWVILADIRDNETNVTGFTPANSTPYSYATTNPQSCVEYKVVLYTGGDFQLNELELYAG